MPFFWGGAFEKNKERWLSLSVKGSWLEASGNKFISILLIKCLLLSYFCTFFDWISSAETDIYIYSETDILVQGQVSSSTYPRTMTLNLDNEILAARMGLETKGVPRYVELVSGAALHLSLSLFGPVLALLPM